MGISAPNGIKHGYLPWGLGGIILVGLFIFLFLISSQFDYALSTINKPIISLVGVLMAAGLVYLVVVLCFAHTVFSKELLIWVIAVGFLLRLSMVTSTPMLEDDYFRYLWDGGVLANGFNPYTYSPRDILEKHVHDIPEALSQLASDSGPVIQRVNYPWLRTIYPPIAEGAFAVAYVIGSWSLTSWRLVLLAADVITLFLLFTTLRRLNISLAGIAIYWWNPLLVKEIYNSGHMDVIIFPFLLGTMLLAIQRRYFLASSMLGLAVGTKFWPVALLPIVLRPILRDPKRLIPSLLLFACLSTAMALPFSLAGLDAESGFSAYGRHWEMNDALFMVILWAIRLIIKVLEVDAGYVQLVARTLVVCILVAWTLWLVKRNDLDPGVTGCRFLFVIAALFILSPTQFPWYYLWMLPFLAIIPRSSLLCLTVLLPLYNLRFYFGARGMVTIHDNGIVWLEFVPVWCLLLWEWYKKRTTIEHHKELTRLI